MPFRLHDTESRKIKTSDCVRKGDVEMGGDKWMSSFQIFYLHIPILTISPLLHFLFYIHSGNALD
jgi:hypothetical protein